MTQTQVVYRFEATDKVGASVLPDAYELTEWTPSLFSAIPPNIASGTAGYLKNWLFHLPRFFRRPAKLYRVYSLAQGEEILSQCILTPSSSRFRFMGPKDAQVGLIFTPPPHRNKKLANIMVKALLEKNLCPGRSVWWITEADNTYSRKLCERAGFKFVAHATRKSFMNIISYYSLTDGEGEHGPRPGSGFKRCFDFLFSLLGLAIASPILAGIAISIKLEDGGPVFFRGKRIGLKGEPFRIFKFRSMVVNAEKIGGPSTADDDPRITRIGKIIRKYKLDELPQLLNVFKGDMSLVGPRPEVKHYTDMYTEEEKAILTMRPGITDWASLWNSDEGAMLAGSSDPEKDYLEKIRPEKIRLQLKYVRERSFWMDLKILWLTFISIGLRLLAKQPVSRIQS